MEKNHGSCLCGSVQFELRGAFEHFFLCHCAHCQKDTGSAHAANLFSSSATLHWVAGQDRVVTYHLPDTRHVKAFCSTCGSALPHASEGVVVVPAGCLDTTPRTPPAAHLFTRSRAEWDHELERLPDFDTLPKT